MYVSSCIDLQKKKKKKRLSLSIISCEGKPMSLFCISLIVTISAVKMPNFRSHSGNAQVRNLMEVLNIYKNK